MIGPAPHAVLPPALEKVAVIRRVYPDLYARELARTPVSWDHLRQMSNTRWLNTHPEAKREFRLRTLAQIRTPASNRTMVRVFWPIRAEAECATYIISVEGADWRHDTAFGFQHGEELIFSGLAYGLGQAKPGTKMLAYGADAASNPHTQLKWFDAYAVGRYGGVCPAADARRAKGWW